jgi:3-isopropylmalate dehydrogenase
MTRLRVAVLPGDGIGPEVTREAVRILQAVGWAGGVDVRLEEHPIGAEAIRTVGMPLPPATRDACLDADAVLLGAVGHPAFEHLPPVARPEAGLLALRQALGGFANLRPVTGYDALADISPIGPARVRGADVLIVRELLGGLYFAEPRGFDDVGGTAWNTLRYSRAEIARVAHVAFTEARVRRGLVTSVDKANVLETSQLWRAVVTEVGREYPDVRLEHMYIDTCALRLVLDPRHFDVILTDNLFGDILSDEAAALGGSLGLLPSATLGGPVALYEPVHGSAPDLAGRDAANPIGAILCVAMLLRHSAGLGREAADVVSAVHSVLADGLRTVDLAGTRGGAVGTRAMGLAIEHALVERLERRRAYHAV